MLNISTAITITAKIPALITWCDAFIFDSVQSWTRQLDPPRADSAIYIESIYVCNAYMICAAYIGAYVINYDKNRK